MIKKPINKNGTQHTLLITVRLVVLSALRRNANKKAFLLKSLSVMLKFKTAYLASQLVIINNYKAALINIFILTTDQITVSCERGRS